jgi:hypothetical protein
MRQKLIALVFAVTALAALAGCALPQAAAFPTMPTTAPVAIPAGPGGLSIAAVPCPQSSAFLFCIGVLP